jgi:hypothetical protein
VTHMVQVKDRWGKPMQLSVYLDIFDNSGSWHTITKGMIRYDKGVVRQDSSSEFAPDSDAELYAPGHSCGLVLETFTSWGTVNRSGTGTVSGFWAVGLTPGAIDWSIV